MTIGHRDAWMAPGGTEAIQREASVFATVERCFREGDAAAGVEPAPFLPVPSDCTPVVRRQQDALSS